MGHVHRREYDAFEDRNGKEVAGRHGADVYLIGQVLNDAPTLVKCDTAADIEGLEAAGQGAMVSIICTEKKGKFTAGPGLVTVIEGNNTKRSAA